MHRQAFSDGVRLFNARDYFAAHEALEDAWRETRGDERAVLQGLVQFAVAMHHLSTGNRVGATSVLTRAARNLNGGVAMIGEVAIRPARAQAEAWLEHLRGEAPQPPFPRLGSTSPG